MRFKVTGYDPGQPMVIDPTLIFSTFTGSTADNWGFTATPGPTAVFMPGELHLEAVSRFARAYQTVFGGGINEDQFTGL
ncbi:MAG: hypothetical protein IPG38_15705 [Chitinophagaceae bacterium]|nr:hypothetical protein [Chitinophagaceae bacterium]